MDFFIEFAYNMESRVNRHSHTNMTRRCKEMENIIVDNAKVMAKGQITLPKDIREALGVAAGDRVTLIRQNDQVIMMNSAVYAMKMLQRAMEGEAEKAGLRSETDVDNLISEMRAEER
jgi:AbrB family looped-hinge helix DNA binding protein